MKSGVKPILVICCIAIALPAGAGGLAVFPPEGTNLERGSLDAIGAVMTQAYAECSQQKVIGPAEAGQAPGLAESPGKAAAELGVDEYLMVEAVRLDQKMLVTATRYTADGSLVFRAQMAAYSMDDMEQVAERLARALRDKVPVSQTQDLHNVTEKEASPENRLFSEKVVGFKLAGLFGMCSADQSGTGVVSAQFDLRLEARTFFLEFGAGLKLAASSDHPYNGGLFAEVGGSYYLMEAENSPYFGLGVIARLDFEGDSLANLAPYAQLGLMMFRSSSTRLYVDLRVSHDLFVHKVSQDEEYRLTEVGLLLGVGW